jgi:peptidoglycan L-alanyl-D-glutamate endopeptidase CwlK
MSSGRSILACLAVLGGILSAACPASPAAFVRPGLRINKDVLVRLKGRPDLQRAVLKLHKAYPQLCFHYRLGKPRSSSAMPGSAAVQPGSPDRSWIYAAIRHCRQRVPEQKGKQPCSIARKERKQPVRVFVFEDFLKKDFRKRLEQPDLADMFHYAYRRSFPQTTLNHDPGRIRHDGFFRYVYNGRDRNSIRPFLTNIAFAGNNIRVHHRACPAFLKWNELIGQQVPPIERTWLQSGGIWNWRNIAGTQRLSTHSFAMSIDLAVSQSAYWRWKKNVPRKFPESLIRTAEEAGFIWGGYWYHYDTMHFEYRPELLLREVDLSLLPLLHQASSHAP